MQIGPGEAVPNGRLGAAGAGVAQLRRDLLELQARLTPAQAPGQVTFSGVPLVGAFDPTAPLVEEIFRGPLVVDGNGLITVVLPDTMTAILHAHADALLSAPGGTAVQLLLRADTAAADRLQFEARLLSNGTAVVAGAPIDVLATVTYQA